MLELDDVQRTKNTLDPQLRAKIRWVAARANGCEYTQAYAKADLLAAGGSESDLKVIEEAFTSLPKGDQELYRFVRLLCQQSHVITDEHVARLLEMHGPTDLAGIVLAVAYSNFQDRLMLALGVEVEEGGPLPPLGVKFDWEAVKQHPISVPPRPEIESANKNDVPTRVEDENWTILDDQTLADRLESQKRRQPRIPAMAPEQVEAVIWPHLYPPKAAVRIVWHNVTFGYQPDLLNHWFFTLRRFHQESNLSGVFRQSVFWVITRATQCNYCMGHTQMLMEVAGLNEDEIQSLVRDLASGDWSRFDPQERATLHFARKITAEPSKLNDKDRQALVNQWGEVRALDTMWYISWCNFMVRVSNAFQIPLETENVFFDLHNKQRPQSN